MTQAQTPFPYSIDGLDPASGLRRMESDIELYAALLRDFVATEKDAAQAIADALARNDRAAATRRAHTVKGLAGTFGAVRLHPAAQSLETALRETAPAAHSTAITARLGPRPKVAVANGRKNVPTAAPILPAAAATPWPVARISVG